jgi:hypothetical protein
VNEEQKRIVKLAADMTKQLSLIPDSAHSATIPREALLMMALICSYVEKMDCEDINSIKVQRLEKGLMDNEANHIQEVMELRSKLDAARLLNIEYLTAIEIKDRALEAASKTQDTSQKSQAENSDLIRRLERSEKRVTKLERLIISMVAERHEEF